MKIVLAFISFMIGGQVFADSQEPDSIKIVQVRASGTGCNDSTARAVLSPDGKTFSVFMDHYSAAADPAFTLDRKSCTLNVQVQASPGWSFSLSSADYRGFITAEAGSQVSHQVLYAFDGSAPPNERPGFENSKGRYSFLQKVFNGPMNNDYFIHNVIDPSVQLWSSCSGSSPTSLFIQTFLISRIYSPGSQAEITLDTVDGSLAQQFSWSWKRCGNSYQPKPPTVGPAPMPGRGGGRRPPRFPN